MIISASRRTDIPAYFSDWFLTRIEEQYACVRNPINIHQVSKIALSPDVVDCIVFWSKNPKPMLSQLSKLKNYMYYFQFTLNAYGSDLEGNLPPLQDRIATFKALADSIGRERVIWRYDPIIINQKYTIHWHMKNYSALAEELASHTEKCIISFLDLYAGISKSMQSQGIQELCSTDKAALAKALSQIAHSHGLLLDTCAENIDLTALGIGHASCIDAGLISRLLGCSLDIKKDKNQRPQCGCASSIDLGLYNTCQHGCVYCYANHDPNMRRRNFQAYDIHSPLLCSRLTECDEVKERKVKSNLDLQLHLFSAELPFMPIS